MNQNETLQQGGRVTEGTSRDEMILADADDTKPMPVQQDADGPEGHPEPSFGDRLRVSRERHGMSLQDCASVLRLPVRLLRKLESDDYGGIDYSVYLCGYLRKYADFVHLDRAHVDAQLESLETRQPDLVVTNVMPAWKYGLQRYSSALTYIVLTAVIVVPLIWLGLNGVLKQDIARLQPLNATPVGTPEQAPAPKTGIAAAPRHAASGQSGATGQVQAQKPLMASIAPFSAMRSVDQLEATPVSAPKAVVADGTRLTVALQQPSWVEITDTSGKRLEYALLPAGTHRAYHSDQALNVRIGNADGAQVDVDGKPVALDRFRHANVAHFDIGNDGDVSPDNS